MKCPKCGARNATGSKECDGCGVIFKDIRNDQPAIDLNCPFNDHGRVCGKRGSLSDSTLGGGPWYCPEHFWLLKGRPLKNEIT